MDNPSKRIWAWRSPQGSSFGQWIDEEFPGLENSPASEYILRSEAYPENLVSSMRVWLEESHMKNYDEIDLLGRYETLLRVFLAHIEGAGE